MPDLLIGSDHAGFELKQELIGELSRLGWQMEDLGTHSQESCDYPLVAHAVCKAVAQKNSKGILICGTGIGMSIAANRHPEIRAALCSNEISARLARRHNNANVLCLGSRIIGRELALAIVVAFLDAEFEGGRHQRRIDELNWGPTPAAL